MDRKRIDQIAGDAGRALSKGDALGAARSLGPVMPHAYRLQHAGALWAWGVAQGRLGQYAEAERALRAVVPVSGGRADVAVELALMVKRQGRFDDAEAMLREIVAQHPMMVRAGTMLSEVLADTKREDEARRVLEGLARRVGNDPAERGRLLSARARLGVAEGESPDPLLAECAAAIGDERVPRLTRGMIASFAGGVCHRAKRHDEAFALWTKGKALRGLAWDADAHDARVDALIDAWTDPSVVPQSERAGSGVDGTGLVFIVGMPRSGTSLLEQMLGCHPRVTALGEREDLTRAAAVVCRPAAAEYPLVTDTSGLTAARMGELGAAVDRSLRGEPGPAREDRVFTDKMPFNVFHVPYLLRLLPGAKVVHIARHPLDTCLSYYSFWFNTPHGQTNDLVSLGRYYLAYARVVDAWRGALARIGAEMLEVSYDRVVSSPEPTLRRVLAHAGLAWDGAVLSPEKSERVVATASRTQVQAPINTASVGRWREYEAHLQPLIETLGGIDAVEAMGSN